MYLKLKLKGKVIGRVELDPDKIFDGEDPEEYDHEAKMEMVWDWFIDRVEGDLIEGEELPEEELKEASNSLKNWVNK